MAMPRNAPTMLALFAGLGLPLLAVGRNSYPNLHLILDTSMALLSGVLAVLFWARGTRISANFPKLLALAFAATSVLEFIHIAVTVEWAGVLAPIADVRGVLRPMTWPPAAHVLPIGVGCAIWLLDRAEGAVRTQVLIMLVAAAGLLVAFQFLPIYTPPGPLGITRPALIAPPVLWAVVGWAAWQKQRQTTNRLFPLLIFAAVPLFLGNVSQLYSIAPHDAPAMVAHLGKVIAYLGVLVSVMQMAAVDFRERRRAEAELADINQGLEQRVEERTRELAESNQTLEREAEVRRRAEERAQAQLGRLNLLHHITRAIGERQDLNSIYQVAIRSIEDELPVDFGCLCLYDSTDQSLTVACVGVNSTALAFGLAMPERARVSIDENGLSRCVRGELVYEPDIAKVDFPFPRRLAGGGLRAFVAAPLQVESQVFGVMIAARVRPDSFSSGECEFLRQLSEHVALAAHQAQLYGALQQAYDDLRQTQQAVMQQERLRALGQMASGIAHDINNALSPVALYTESLIENEPGLSARAKDYLETIQRAVHDVANTVARMRDFYRQREPQLTLLPVQLNPLIRQVIDLTRARWSDMAMHQGKMIEMRTELADDVPPVMGIESEIREALINLVLNAVDAMPLGGTVTLRTAKAGLADRSYAQVEVADDGVGMDEETRRRCLEPFFTTKGERGTGLGLAMVYGVARRHGAEIDIDSAPAEGTTMRLSFPVAAPVTAVAKEPKAAARAAARLRILVVDDDPLILKSLRDALESDGHIVTTANGGQLGIDTFRAAHGGPNAFAVVFTDLGMPHVDGRKVANAIKKTSPATPVVLLTGWGQRLVAEDDVPDHVDHVLSKPPKLRELRETLALCGAHMTS
jgi:signal transduction histidine kinase/ActR/RegA family two-component response regulator